MSVTLEQIVDETSKWPENAVAELVDRIMLAKYGSVESDAEDWMQKAGRRAEEIRSGAVDGVCGEVVSQKVREIVRP